VEPPAPLVDPAAPTPPAADPAPATPPAEGPPPALPPEAAPPPLPPPAPAPKRRVRGGHQREEREEPWGECFKMALVHPEGGRLTAFSATCLIHTADNSRCNKSLNLGARFSLEEAQRRIKNGAWMELQLQMRQAAKLYTCTITLGFIPRVMSRWNMTRWTRGR
jgi:hypothetical protein